MFVRLFINNDTKNEAEAEELERERERGRRKTSLKSVERIRQEDREESCDAGKTGRTEVGDNINLYRGTS